MASPHPVLIELAAGRALPRLDDPAEGLEAARSAVDHRLGALLARELTRSGLSLGPDADRLLAVEELATRAQHRRVAAALGDAVEALAAAGFEVGLMKGLDAARRWWPCPELRPCVDIDLFVNPADVGRLDRLVAALGAPEPSGPSIAPLAATGRLQYVALDDRAVPIDLHVDPFNLVLRTRGLEEVWARTESVACGGGTVRVLDPATALVHAAINTLRDGLGFLQHFVDVRAALDDPRLDWDVVDGLAARNGYRTLVYTALTEVCATLGVAYPGPPPPSRGRRRLLERLYPSSVRLQGSLSYVRGQRRQLLLPLLAQGRGAEAAWAFNRRFFPPPALLAAKHPQGRTYLDRLVRFRVGQQDELRRARHRFARTREDVPSSPRPALGHADNTTGG